MVTILLLCNISICRQAVDDALDMKEQGLISPIIKAKFPLESINEAIELIKKEQPIGKIIVDMSKTQKKKESDD